MIVGQLFGRVWNFAAFLVGLVSFSLSAQAQTMMLHGAFTVSQNGSAIYDIPISVPPGTNGVQPVLSLQYDSARGNGLLGVGWTLSGIPAIQRCSKLNNGIMIRPAIKDTYDDAFCIDDQELKLVAGDYGHADSEYRTEIESFNKIIAVGALGNGPASFKVWTKSGQIFEFGVTADSRVISPDEATVRLWSVNKISDQSGNYMRFAYVPASDGNQIVPDVIEYTGNDSQNLMPFASVRFLYENRFDTETKYSAGLKKQTDQRLAEINTFNGPDAVLSYKIGYGDEPSDTQVTVRSVVSAVTLCDGAGIRCLPATEFETYKNEFARFTEPTADNPFDRAAFNIKEGISFLQGDWNGDGHVDVLSISRANGENIWYLNEGNFQFSRHDDLISRSDLDTAGHTDYSDVVIGDWNKDGLTDLMFQDRSYFGVNRWFLNKGGMQFEKIENLIVFPEEFVAVENTNPRSYTVGEPFVGDFNGDGLPDIMFKHGKGQNIWYRNVTEFGDPDTATDDQLAFSLQRANPIDPSLLFYRRSDNTPIHYIPLFGDWNADGATDVAWRGTHDNMTGPMLIFLNSGDMSFEQMPSVSHSLIKGEHDVFAVDFNGDGATDFLAKKPYTGENGWFTNDGRAHFSVTMRPLSKSEMNDDNPTSVFGDWNGDGVQDFMSYWRSDRGHTYWFRHFGDFKFGKTFDRMPRWQTDVYSNSYSGDWNGDGTDDIVYIDTNRSRLYGAWQPRPDVVTKITNGLGEVTKISYDFTTNPTVYSTTRSSSYPEYILKNPISVVSKVEAGTSGAGDYVTKYSYVNAVLDQNGRGFQGFEKQIVEDLETGISSVRVFHTAYPFTGETKSETQWLGGINNQLLSRRVNSYSSVVVGADRVFPFLSEQVEEMFDLDGTALPRRTTQYSYDDFGNPTEIVVTTSDGMQQTTVNQYSNDEANWFIGRLLRSSVTSVVPD